MTDANIAGLWIGIGMIVCLGLVFVFANPMAGYFRALQTRMYGERLGKRQTPGKVRLGAGLGVLLGITMVILAATGSFGTH